MFSAKQSKASIFTCTLAWALMSGVVAPAWSAESEASMQASTQASTGAASQAQQGAASEASHQSSSQAATENSTNAGNQASSHTGYANNSLSQRNGLVGTPTVINRGNVGREILQAAGQTRSTSSGASSRRVSHGGTRTYSKKRIAHWKTQYWNGKSAATAKAAK